MESDSDMKLDLGERTAMMNRRHPNQETKTAGSPASGMVALVLAGFICLFAAQPSAQPAATDRGQAPFRIAQGAVELVERANSLYAEGEFAKAILLYRRAEQRGADPSVIAFNIGNALFRQDKLSEAAASFRKSLRLRTSQAAGVSSGTAEIGNEKDAAPALFNLAAVLFRLEQWAESIAAYRRGLRLDPGNFDAWLYLADAYTRSGDAVGAQQALETARSMAPDDATILYQLAETHVALKEHEAAIKLVREAYARLPEEIDFLFYIGDLHRSRGELEKAASAYREGLTRRPQDADGLYKLADVLAADGKPYLAMDMLQSALGIKPDFSDAAVFLGNLAADARWWERAERAYLSALEAGNNEGLIGLQNLAYAFYQSRDPARSVAALERALALRPKDLALRAEVDQYRELARESGIR